MRIEKRFQTIPKLLALLAVSVAIFLLCIGLLMLSSRGYFSKQEPVKKEDVSYLCEKLEIKDDSICNNSQAVYPDDFSVFISKRFEDSSASYQDFQNIFSIFQMEFSVHEDPNIIISSYDLNRDEDWDLILKFDGTLEENIIRPIVFREDYD